MNGVGQIEPKPTDRLRMGCWAIVAVVILLVTGMIATAALGTGAYLFWRHSRSDGLAGTSVSSGVIVRSPSFMGGPAIEMSLPAGCDLTSSSVDADGGNWWYENASDGHIHLLIAASRISGEQPELSDAYFQHVMRIVEVSGGEQITAMDTVRDVQVGPYTGREADYDVAQPGGGVERAAALLLRRESDDLLIVLYGDGPMRAEVDDAARKVFESLHPRPTPQRYDVHSAIVAYTAAARA